MKKSRFTESQIVSILKEADAGLKVMDMRPQFSALHVPLRGRRFGGLTGQAIKSAFSSSRLMDEVIALVDLYTEQYSSWNVQHFYSFIGVSMRANVAMAGSKIYCNNRGGKKGRKRGKRRQRRERPLCRDCCSTQF